MIFMGDGIKIAFEEGWWG